MILTVVFMSCNNTSIQQVETKSPGATPNDWVRIGPGGGGSTFIPTFSYANTHKFMSRCDMTGSYLTNNGGKSFSQINYPNGSRSFANDPMDSSTIYIGSSSLNKSSDGGVSWERIFPEKVDIAEKYFL